MTARLAATGGGSGAALDRSFRGQRDPFRRGARPIPGIGRTSLALDAAGASPAAESRLAALVLCAAVILGPSDPVSGSLSIRPLALAHRLATDVAAVRASLALLDRAGLLRADAVPDTAPGAWSGDEIVVRASWQGVAAPAVASAVDWTAVFERLGGHPAALAVALAFAESTVAPGEQTPITVPQLAAGARYSDRTVKGALAHLVEAGVLARGPRIGARSRYAFSEAALGLVPFPDDGDAPAASPEAEAAIAAELRALRTQVDAIRAQLGGQAQGNAAVSAPRRGAAAPTVRPDLAAPTPGDEAPTAFLELHGTRIALPPGATLRLEADESGQLWYRMGGVRFGPIAP